MTSDHPDSTECLPTAGDVCFCCESPLGRSVHVLGDGLFLCGKCDRELRRRRFAWKKSEAALDAQETRS